MKTYIRTSLMTLLLLALTAAPARANDEALAALGGFFAGIITGAVIEHNDDYNSGVRISVGDRYGHHDRYARYNRCQTHHRDNCRACVPVHHKPRGHWEIKEVRVWIPGHWDFVISRHGNRVRVWEKGRYEWHRERVWVGHHKSSRHYRRD